MLPLAQDLPKATLATGLVAGTLAAIYSVRAFMQWYRLSHVPGPFWAAFSKYWMVSSSLKGRQPTAIKEVNDKYGMLAPVLYEPAWVAKQAARLMLIALH